MSELMHEMVTTQYVRCLNAFKIVMDKTRSFAEQNKFDVNSFLDIKLAPDMMNFTRQIQIMTDNAKGAVARLTGTENPKFEDIEKTWTELEARVDKTINFISKFKAEDFDNYAQQTITFPWNPGMQLGGRDYFVSFAIPNFYFHLTTAYALLRGAGVPIGKSHFLGELNWKKI